MAFALKDSERTRFGLGWEYVRRGHPINQNPFRTKYAREQFESGYRSFKCSKPETLLYNDPNVIPEFVD